MRKCLACARFCMKSTNPIGTVVWAISRCALATYAWLTATVACLLATLHAEWQRKACPEFVHETVVYGSEVTLWLQFGLTTRLRRVVSSNSGVAAYPLGCWRWDACVGRQRMSCGGVRTAAVEPYSMGI